MKSEKIKIRKVVIFTVVFAVLAFLSVGCASAATIYVPDDYTKIQWAVDNASAGDTIIVRDGTYTENVVVDVPSLVICSENGSVYTTIDGGERGDVVKITANNVTIEGFTIADSDYLHAGLKIESSRNTITTNNISNNHDGIDLSSSSNNVITTNTISNNIIGIEFYSSSNNTITSNNISYNTYDGIYLYSSNNNTITSNTIFNYYLPILLNYGINLYSSSNNTITLNNISNSNDGIYLYSSSNNTVTTNNISNNGNGIYLNSSSNSNTMISNSVSNNNGYGIGLCSSSNNTITTNNISYNNYDGIFLYLSSKNIITSNTISYNNDNGIFLGLSSENTMTTNNISYNNESGIDLYSSSNNTITINNISYNNGYSIVFVSCSNNKIYINNFIDNSDSVSNSNNTWNSTEKIVYTYNGSEYTSYLGNYWSDYEGSDADGNGIGDIPYSIDGDKDYYPLMDRFENYIKVEKEEREVPGFEALFAIAGLLAVAYLVRRRK